MSDVVLVGSKRLGAIALEWLTSELPADHRLAAVITIDDRDDTRTMHEVILAGARALNIPVTVGDEPPIIRAVIEEAAPALVIVAGWYRILDVGSHPDTLFVGFHASLLPRYRGSAPLVWQIINGESEIGLSMFELTSGMDEGGIVAQATRPFDGDESIADALAWVEGTSRNMLGRHAVKLLERSAVLTPQDHAKASYCGPRRPDDGRIDWTSPAPKVHDFVRAQTRPYPGAFTQLPDGRRLTVWSTALEHRSWQGVPGTIVDRYGEQVVVACGAGAVVVAEVEVQNEGPAAAGRVLRSGRLGRAGGK